MIPGKEKRLLRLVGITYNQIESGVYAVILEEVDGVRRIPIIIGFPEAQAIECKLQEIVTPRPLTHDLMVNLLTNFGVSLTEVHIQKLPSGVFAGELVLRANGETTVIDARSSDAIALAIRVGAPIFTSRKVLDEVGFEPSKIPGADLKTPRTKVREARKDSAASHDFDNISTPVLKFRMTRAADNEDYESASRIKAEIERRGEDPNDLSDAVDDDSPETMNDLPF